MNLTHTRPALNVDPIAFAQRHAPGNETAGLALALMQNGMRTQAAQQAQDTHYSSTAKDAHGIITRCGFELLGSYEIDRIRNAGDPNDCVNVYCHSATGAIATLESYGESMNACNVYFVIDELMYRSGKPMAGCGTSFESLKHPDWRRSPEFQDRNPDDLLVVGKYDARWFFVSRFAELLSKKPVKRPVHPYFSVLTSVFTTGHDIEKPTQQYGWEQSFQHQSNLAVQRATDMGLDTDLFGGPDSYFVPN